MRVIFAFFLLLAGGQLPANDAPTVLVFGDSLSAGYGIDVDQSWATLLQARLEQQGYEHRVVNASIGGDTTESGAARIAQAIEAFSPSVIILELGGNDGLRGIPPDTMRANLASIVKTGTDSGAAVVMLGIRIPPNYGARYIAEFENVFRQIATEMDVPWVEFFLEGIALNKELMQDDGIHPNAIAQPILLDNAWPIISNALAKQGN